jgi:hypothetical protein
MSVKDGPLTVVRVDLVPVGFVNQHRSQEIVLMRYFKAIQNLMSGLFERQSKRCPILGKFKASAINSLIQ